MNRLLTIVLASALSYLFAKLAFRYEFQSHLQTEINKRELKHFHNFPYVYLAGIEHEEDADYDSIHINNLIQEAYNTYLLNLQTMGDTTELNYITENVDSTNIVKLTREFITLLEGKDDVD